LLNAKIMDFLLWVPVEHSTRITYHSNQGILHPLKTLGFYYFWHANPGKDGFRFFHRLPHG